MFVYYGINDGIYQPLDAERFATITKGVTKLIEQCKEAGVKEVYLITPPILTTFAKWETELKVQSVRVIDL